MKIFVRFVRAKGKQIILDVEHSDTIGAVKAKIQERLENRVLSGNQRLIVNGSDLQDDITLKEHGIGNGATLMLVELLGYQLYVMDDTDGMIHTVYVEHNTFQVMTIGELKQQCQVQLCCQADNQLLVFCGRQLDNDKTLVNYGITRGSTVHLVPLRGAKGGRPYHVCIDAPEETIVIHTCECIRIQDLKRSISERLNIPLAEQRLTTKSGQELKDEKSLKEYGIKLRSTLILYRIPGVHSGGASDKYDGKCQICGKLMEAGDPETFSLESRPDIRRLQRITSIEGRVVEVADRVTRHWERMAQVLRLERSVTRQVKRREKTLQGACIAVLQYWLVGKGRRPVSWETLMNSLREMGQRDLYEELILVRREGIRLDDGRIVIYF